MADEHFDAILRSLVEIALKQDRINEDFRAFGERVTVAIEQLTVTQTRLEALLQRLVNPSGNGHEGTPR
jgi:hypothetical protein